MANQSASVSFPLFGILGVLFVGLKLGEVGAVAEWSWWWVLAPFWGPLAFALCAIVIVVAVGAIAGMVGSVAAGMASRRRLRAMTQDE